MSTLPTATHPSHLCYIKQNWADSWVETPLLRCLRLEDKAAPGHASGQFKYRFGRGMLPAIGSRAKDSAPVNIPRADLIGKYVRVLIDFGDGDVLSWFGIFVDIDLKRTGDLSDHQPSPSYNASGRDDLTAFGLTFLLEHSKPVTQTLVKTAAGAPTTTTLIDTAIPFNAGSDGRHCRKRVGTANRDSSLACFTDTDLTTTPVLWTAQNAVDYLLTNFSPKDAGGNVDVPFVIGSSAALAHQLPRFEYQDQTVWQILNRLINRKRGVGFNAIVNGSNQIELVTWSHSAAALPLPSGGSIPANPNTRSINFTNSVNIQDAHIVTSAIRTYDEVIARGAPIGSVFSIAPGANANEDWSEDSEDDYNEAASLTVGYGSLNDDEKASANADARARDEVHDVYSHWRIASNWDGFSASGDRAVWSIDEAGTVDLGTTGPIFVSSLRFADYVPLRAQVDYSGAITPSDDTDSTNDYLAAFTLWHVPETPDTNSDSTIDGNGYRWVYAERLDAAVASGDQKREHTFTIQTRMMDDKPGVALEVVGGQQHYIASGRFTPVDVDYDDIPQGQALNLNDWLTTVYVPLNQRLVARVPASPTSGDVSRSLTIDVPDAHLDRLIPGTTVGIDNTGTTVTTSGGWLRDDRDRLKDIATIAHAWYSVERATLRLSFKALTYGFAVGHLITSIVSQTGTQAINTAITSVTLNVETGVTTLQTQYDELDFQTV